MQSGSQYLISQVQVTFFNDLQESSAAYCSKLVFHALQHPESWADVRTSALGRYVTCKR